MPGIEEWLCALVEAIRAAQATRLACLADARNGNAKGRVEPEQEIPWPSRMAKKERPAIRRSVPHGALWKFRFANPFCFPLRHHPRTAALNPAKKIVLDTQLVA
jgi:hypothetical protein